MKLRKILIIIAACVTAAALFCGCGLLEDEEPSEEVTEGVVTEIQ